MKSRLIATVAVAGALSLAITGTASASALGHPKHKPKPKPKPAATAPQVSGTTLERGLLPAASIGDGFISLFTIGSGKNLAATKLQYSVPTMSCGDFESSISNTGYGNSAGAAELFLNSAWTGGPSILLGYQYVLQFPSTKAATTFYGQALAKYQGCQNFTESNPADTTPGGGTIDVSASTLTKTTVGKHQAFQVVQLSADSESSGFTGYNDILVVIAGTNVYQLWEASGTNDEPSPTAMSQLISQVQKLYPRGK
jgi:hypothetical protein